VQNNLTFNDNVRILCQIASKLLKQEEFEDTKKGNQNQNQNQESKSESESESESESRIKIRIRIRIRIKNQNQNQNQESKSESESESESVHQRRSDNTMDKGKYRRTNTDLQHI
jgi:hypothetical protein